MGSPASETVISDLVEPTATAPSTETAAPAAAAVTETLPTPTARPLNEVVGDNEKPGT